jgi:hypothetical protein
MPISPVVKYVPSPRSLQIFFPSLQIPLHFATVLLLNTHSNMGCYCSKSVRNETERAPRPVSIPRQPSTPSPLRTNDLNGSTGTPSSRESLGYRAPGAGKWRVRLPPPEVREWTALPHQRHPYTSLLQPIRIKDGKVTFWEYDGGALQERLVGQGPLPNAHRPVLQDVNQFPSLRGEVLGGKTASF